MDEGVDKRRGESEAHAGLKRLAVLWAQAQGYTACAVEVTLAQSRYRADVAAYRALTLTSGCTAVFECKQALADLRRDNCCAATLRARLATCQQRREVLERRLRVHYPTLRTGDSLFPEWDASDLGIIGHRGYTNLLREIATLQARLHGGTKFERLVQYNCANLFFLVVPHTLHRAAEVPPGWGALLESGGALVLHTKPLWRDTTTSSQTRFLHRIAAAGTRLLNNQFRISFDQITDQPHTAISFAS